MFSLLMDPNQKWNNSKKLRILATVHFIIFYCISLGIRRIFYCYSIFSLNIGRISNGTTGEMFTHIEQKYLAKKGMENLMTEGCEKKLYIFYKNWLSFFSYISLYLLLKILKIIEVKINKALTAVPKSAEHDLSPKIYEASPGSRPRQISAIAVSV